jgi:hypothetical protein
LPITKKKDTFENFSSLDLSLHDADDFLYRLQRLFEKSDYHDQILLSQTAPVEWGWKKIEQFFRCTSHQARFAILQRTSHGDLSKPVDSRGNKPFDPALAQAIQDFYLCDEVSRQSSNTKDTRTPKNKGTVVIRYLTMSIGETFEYFKLNNPSVKVSRSKFFSLRPSWVREDCPHQVCMCSYHQNVDLLLTVSSPRKTNWDFTLFFQAINRTMNIQLKMDNLLNQTVCLSPSEDCYYRRCDDCCNSVVSDLFVTNDEIDEQGDTAWSFWSTVNNRIELQHRSGSFRSLIEQLNTIWPAFITHTYCTRQQREYIKSIKIDSSLTTFAVIQLDFAENFSFIIQKEIQSAYWNKKQATVFTVFMKIGDDHRNMVIISNYMAHDTTFVYCCQKLITMFIHENFPSVCKINYVR